MILQNSVKRIITEVGKQFGLTSDEAQDHYIQYIEEFILKSMYDANFDILRIEGLGTITPGLVRTKNYLRSCQKSSVHTSEVEEKLNTHIQYMEELNSTLRHKKLFR